MDWLAANEALLTHTERRLDRPETTFKHWARDDEGVYIVASTKISEHQEYLGDGVTTIHRQYRHEVWHVDKAFGVRAATADETRAVLESTRITGQR